MFEVGEQAFSTASESTLDWMFYKIIPQLYEAGQQCDRVISIVRIGAVDDITAEAHGEISR
jgi:hypothetical protein